MNVLQALLGELLCNPRLHHVESANQAATLLKKVQSAMQLGMLVFSAPLEHTQTKLDHQPAFLVLPTRFLSSQAERTRLRVFLVQMAPGPSRG
jgi:hypothetical protein